MRRSTLRTFQLADALILIGGIAVTLALVRRNWDLFFAGRIFEAPPAGWSLKVVAHWALAVIGYLVAQAMAVAAVALLVIRLRNPRPSLSRLARQPGLVACAAVTMVVALSVAEYLARVKLIGVANPLRFGFSYETFNVLMDGIGYAFPRNGYAVAAAWLPLVLGRRWHAEPGWIDTGGRAVGIFWLAMIPLYACLQIIAGQP